MLNVLVYCTWHGLLLMVGYEKVKKSKEKEWWKVDVSSSDYDSLSGLSRVSYYYVTLLSYDLKSCDQSFVIIILLMYYYVSFMTESIMYIIIVFLC